MNNYSSGWDPDQPQPAATGPTPPGNPPAPTWYGSDPTGPQPITPPHGIRFGDQPSWPSNPAAAPGGGPATLTAPPGSRSPRRRLLELAMVGAVSAMLASGCTFAATQDRVAATNTLGTTTGQLPSTTARPVVQADGSAPDWVAVAKTVSPSVVAITISSGSRAVGQGSGVIVDAEGRIITNNHVVTAGSTRSGLSLTVTLDDKRTFDADIVGTDPATDLAVIKLKNAPNDLVPIALGNADELRVGEPVMAVGNPLGLAGTVTTGIVSALNRPVVTESDPSSSLDGARGERVVTNAVQTSAAINPGNSGGALVNASGQLVGINSAIASTQGSSGNIGIGFAIPVNEARSVSEQLIASGKARHAYLGVAPTTVVVQDGASKRAAVGIGRVYPDTPAANAGLRVDDAVIAVDAEAVDTADSLIAQIRERRVNQNVTLTIVRDGKRQEVKVSLAERPTS
ncbi:MAG: trypsin-like peptidase domain-containing protein [Austwickia sp.]|nr:trypsin-like peptidase domain-containing protein [Austwickia sp.]MBK9101970.1 trypsin-like peptidase domain-containing protein [Austwickia sp.]